MESNPIKVLIIEDNPDDVFILKTNFEDFEFAKFDISYTDRLTEVAELKKHHKFDAILLDLTLPDSTGIDTFNSVYKTFPEAPIVVMTGLTDSELAVKMVKMGAQDYLVKGVGDPSSVARSILYAIERHQLKTQLKQQTRDREISQNKLANIIEFSLDGILVIDGEGKIQLVNPAAENIFHRNEKELLGTHIGQPLTTDRNCEISIIDDNNREVIVEMKVVKINWEEKAAYLATLRDITERKKLEDVVYHSRQMLRKVIDNIPQRVFWKDHDFKYIGCNKPFAQDAHLDSPKEIVGKDDFELDWKASANLYRADDKYIMESNTQKINFEEPQVRQKGEDLWVRTSKMPLHDANGEVIGVLGVYEDITEQKKMIKELEFHATIFEELNDAVIATKNDKEFTITAWNRGAEKVYGWSKDEVLSQSSVKLLRNEFEGLDSKEFLKRILEDGKYSGEVIQCAKDGRRIYIESRLISLRDEQDEITGWIAVNRDITERKLEAERGKNLEAKMMQVQKLESIGILAGGIAHDFNNLLMTILGNVDFALMEMAKENPAREFLKEIETASRRAAELTNQMLAYSGKGKFVIEIIDLTKLIEEMEHLLSVSISKKAVINPNLEPNLPPLEADPSQIRQIVMNLIINASEAIGDKSGIISISTGAIYCDQEYLESTFSDFDLVEGLYVFVEVSDTGCGMTRETIERIFDPFFSTKFTGRGLGLAATMGIVRGHRGAIKVYSEPGKGSTFKALFPSCDKIVQQQEENQKSKDAKKGSGRILIVDDEETVRALAQRGFRGCGFDVLTAPDGKMGLEVYRKYKDSIRLVVLDLTMPHMGGVDAFRELKKINPDVKVLLSSGYSEQDATDRFIGKGLAGFIQKPYKITDMLQKAFDILGIE